MELRVSSPNPGVLSSSSSDSAIDPEEKEISDDDDDDRNHKHRRRESHTQSLEAGTVENILTRPYRKRNNFSRNAFPSWENESQSSETWKDANTSSLEQVSGKFDNRRRGIVLGSRTPWDFNKKLQANQMFSGDFGLGRGRVRDSGTWNQRGPRFSSVDLASQIFPQGSVPPSLLAGRGLPNLSNVHNASWGAFGLISGIPNGGMDLLHSVGLQGTLRQPINPMNMVMPRQRCRDFEERGFCLRGDMCPMEHGINRIVVEDVQSLSQFNLPVSVPSAQPGKPSGSLPTLSTSSATLTSSKEYHGNFMKPGVADDGLSLNGAYSGFGSAGVADLYDPDQPLWNNNRHEKPKAPVDIESAKIDESESLLNHNQNHFRMSDSADMEFPGSTTTMVPKGSSLSVWGRIGNSKNKTDVKEKLDPSKSSAGIDNEMKEDTKSVAGIQPSSHQGKRIETEDEKAMDLSLKTQNNTARTIRRPSQKALRTLFVHGIPQNSNKRESLLSHFQKFGEVIDIYIPLNSERAFVQFSKREEAEAALKAPDAVMGNRFIKLWWANRDSIQDDGISQSSISVPPPGVKAASVSSLATKQNDNLQPPASKGGVVQPSDVSLPDSDHSKPSNGPKVPPSVQKKLQNLEQLKDELRKKQEMLEQKRNDFRRQLNKLEKQATVTKPEAVTERAAKRQKVGIATDHKTITPESTDPSSTMASNHAEEIGDKNICADNFTSLSSKTSTSSVLLQESLSPKKPNGGENSPSTSKVPPDADIKVEKNLGSTNSKEESGDEDSHTSVAV